MDETVEIEFLGKIPSKKNSYTPRKGGHGMFKSKELTQQLDRLAMQIPGDVRDLKLESPEIDFYFRYQSANWDRDNAATSLMDLLVNYGVLVNDNIKRSNGRITIHPAEHGEFDGCRVVLTPRLSEPEHQRYVRPVRKRMIGVLRHIPEESSDGLEDMDPVSTLWDDL